MHKDKKKCWICHFCGKLGHIHSFYFHLHGFPDHFKTDFRKNAWNKVKTEWRSKQKGKSCNVALTSVYAMKGSDWYFDNGCSWHMIGNIAVFTKFKECHAGHVMFSNGIKGQILKKGSINQTGISYLQDIQLVKGLSENLISISQLYD